MYGLYLSASGAHAQSHRMQVLSHNLANVDTPGFKPKDTILQSRFAELIDEGQVPAGLGGADDIGGGVTINEAETEFVVGPMKSTGGKTDFAIHDPEAFFVVQRGGEQLLTRAGNFTIDNTGRLISASNAEVVGSDGRAIQLEPGRPFEVAADGRISQGGNLFELMLGKPKSLGDLSHLGGNEFRPLAQFDLVPKGERKVVAGMLEQSGVKPTAAMMELIETSRVYEANVRMIQNQDSVMGTLISRVLSR